MEKMPKFEVEVLREVTTREIITLSVPATSGYMAERCVFSLLFGPDNKNADRLSGDALIEAGIREKTKVTEKSHHSYKFRSAEKENVA